MRHDWSQSEILTLIALYNEEKTASEISEITNIPINAIKYKIKLLRKDGTITQLYKRCFLCKEKYQ